MAIEKPINDILSSIDNGEYTIPEFQRGYVWNSKQVKEFFRSLYLGYPSGSFLIWKTKEPSKIRGDVKESNSIYHQLILDGQQRLTTIYTIFKGKTPEWYEGVSLRTDLYFNLETEEFEYFMPRKMANNREWINVSDFYKSGGLNNLITKMQGMDEKMRSYYSSKLLVLNKLGTIKDYGYYIKEITLNDIEKVVEIFNLVNKTGTTLNESDLALAIITSNWPEVKDRYREKIREYQEFNYKFSFRFFTRCINILTTKRGKFTSEITEVSKEEYESAWKRLHKILPQILNILRERAYIDSSSSFNTFYVLYILIFYLSENEMKFKTEVEADKAIYWLFMALMWGRYSGSSESYLEKDINILKEKKSLNSLIQELKLYRGSNLAVRPEDIALQGVRSKIYNVFYSSVRAQNAKDWTNPALSLYSKSIGKHNRLEKHHIFPKDILYKKYNSANSLHKAMVNEIANIAFITKDANLEIFTTAPEEYLPKINEADLRKQYVPIDPDLYKVENYEAFLESRRKKVAEGINKFLESYFKNDNKSTIPTDLEPLNAEIEKVEIGIREIISNTLYQACEENPYDEFIPQHLKDKVEHRISKWVSKNPGEDENQFEEFRKKLDFFDLQEYCDIINNKIAWPHFEQSFGSKGILMQRFSQLSELRNSIRHSRKVTDVAVKDGEAAIAWFSSILRPFIETENYLIFQEQD